MTCRLTYPRRSDAERVPPISIGKNHDHPPLHLANMASGVFSLSDLQWSLSNANGSIVVPGSLPSQVHLDLQRAGIITEPLLGINGLTPTQA